MNKNPFQYTMLGEGYEKYLKDTQGEEMDKIKDYSKSMSTARMSYYSTSYFYIF